jgi:adenosylmethionine-8-amino-7-oxononanoate aminotransferase
LAGDVRGVGLLGCIECTLGESGKDHPGVEEKLGAMIDKYCHDMGLIVRPIGNMCVFSPPLIISKAQIDEMMEILAKAIQLTEGELLGATTQS